MTRLRILAGALMMPVTLAGCGLQPLYSGGSTGAVAGALGQVEIAPIEGKAGWLMATELRDRMPSNGSAPLYRVDIRLDDQISGLGVRRDDSVSRERRVLRARYQLVRIGDGSVLLDATAGSDAGIDVVLSEYATIAAENTALERLSAIVADQIVARIALYARRTPASLAVIDPPSTSPTP